MPLSPFDGARAVSFADRTSVSVRELALRYELERVDRELAAVRAARALPESRVERQIRRRMIDP